DDEDRAAAAAQAHELALAALGRALDEPDVYDPAELERLAQEVLRCGRGMPEGIKRRYAAQLRALQAARSRRARIVRAVAVAGIVLVLGVGVILIRGYFRSRDADQAASEITRFLDRDEIDKALRFARDLEQTNPSLFTESSLIEVRGRLKRAQAEDTDRREQV